MKLEYRDKIKLIVADVDGTLTDGGMYISDSGEEFKKYNTKDGMGMKLLIKQGYKVGILSASHSHNTVIKRSEMLGCHYCYVGKESKLEILKRWKEELRISFDEIAYIGDDVNDKAIIDLVGLSVCPSDAVDLIKKSVDYVMDKKGGEGCFREMADRFFILT